MRQGKPQALAWENSQGRDEFGSPWAPFPVALSVQSPQVFAFVLLSADVPVHAQLDRAVPFSS